MKTKTKQTRTDFSFFKTNQDDIDFTSKSRHGDIKTRETKECLHDLFYLLCLKHLPKRYELYYKKPLGKVRPQQKLILGLRHQKIKTLLKKQAGRSSTSSLRVAPILLLSSTLLPFLKWGRTDTTFPPSSCINLAAHVPTFPKPCHTPAKSLNSQINTT